VAQNYQKSWGTEFNNITFFIFYFTTSICVARVPCVRTQNSEKLAQMRSNAEHLLLVPSVSWERVLDRGWGQKI